MGQIVDTAAAILSRSQIFADVNVKALQQMLTKDEEILTVRTNKWKTELL